MSLVRTFHTVRYLRPVQVYARARRQFSHPRPSLSAAPPLRSAAPGHWKQPAHRIPSMLGAESFRFLNQQGDLASSNGWNDSRHSKLWLYNLHYFDDLNARDNPQRSLWHTELIRRWIRENPPGEGVGWDPYPISVRIVNWIKWALAGNPLPPGAVESLAIQARHLCQNLEWHLLGNHLWTNARALLFAGAFFDGPEAADWLSTGWRVLDRELEEQVLPDGGHFERSPMYHSLALEDLLDLWNLSHVYPAALTTGCEAANRIGPLLPPMRRWLNVMCHPDGEISFFNDAAPGIAPSPAELDAYARRLGLGEAGQPAPGITHLQDSGYVRLDRGPAVAILDVGSIGPDYLPGHSHADTLSFELSLFGSRVLVNSGTSTYGRGPQREKERSTTAHSTVVVDGQDSSETWASFRVGRRAYPVGLEVREDGTGGLEVRCGHTGYLRLPGRVRHWRTWRLTDGALQIEDYLEGGFGSAAALFHVAPGVDETGPIACGSDQSLPIPSGALTWNISGGQSVVEPDEFHPGFGQAVPSRRLSVRFAGATVRHEFRW